VPPPTFSIVICNYDYGRFVGQAIESCLAQDYPAERFEVIVVDDGSRDDSRAVIERIARRDARVTHVFQANTGQGGAFATGVFRARNEFVCLLDSDDWYLPGKLSAVAGALERLGPLPAELFLCHDYQFHDEARGARLPGSAFAIRGLARFGAFAHASQVGGGFPFAIPCGQVYSRTLIRRVMEGLPIRDWRIAVDAVLGHASLLVAGEMHLLATPLAVYRVHGTNDSAVIGPDGGYRHSRPSRASDTPRKLALLESYLDTAAVDTREYGVRFGHLKRMEDGDASTRLRLREPLVSFAVVDDGDGAALAGTLAAIRASVHPRIEAIVVSRDPHRAEAVVQAAGICAAVHALPDGAESAHALRIAWHAAQGDYLAWLRAGDRPHPLYATRHVEVHRSGGLAAMSVCDMRPAPSSPASAGPPFIQSSRRPEYLPALGNSLEVFAASPTAACVLRRNRLVARLLDALVDRRWQALHAHADWLVQACAHALGGTVAFADVLVESGRPVADDRKLRGAAPAERPRRPERAIARDLVRRIAEAVAADRLYPPGWHERFLAWLGEA